MEKVKPKIIYEDNQILVLDKPAGLAVTRAETLKSPTLQDWLIDYFHLDSLGLGGRAGIVHRLDRQTSGIILVAKTQNCFQFLQEQFAKRKIVKNYLTLVHNHPESEQFQVNLPIGRLKFGKFGVKIEGKVAQTYFSVLKKFQMTQEKFEAICQNFPKNLRRYLQNHAKLYSLLQAKPTTGRTHQIRVHAKADRLPIVSDSLYTPAKLLKFDNQFCPRLFLHAAEIIFTHPNGAKNRFESQLPKDLLESLSYLEKL